MTIRAITDQIEAFSTYRIVGELMAKKTVAPGTEVEDMNVTQRLVDQFNGNPRFLLLGAFDDRGAAMGYICGEVRLDIYTGQLCAFELIWAVGDRYRKGGVGLALLDEWEKQTKKMGATRSFMGLGAFCDPDKLRFIYQQTGYRLYSESHYKDL